MSILKPFAYVGFACVIAIYFTGLILGGVLFAVIKPVETWQLIQEIKQLKENQ